MSIVGGQPPEERVPAADLAAVAAKQPSKLVVVPLDRSVPVSHRDTAPKAWLQATDHATFRGTARPGECFTFQVAVVSSREVPFLAVRPLHLDGTGAQIYLNCLISEGIGPKGESVIGIPHLAARKVRSLWLYTVVPPHAKGTFKGKIEISRGVLDFSSPPWSLTNGVPETEKAVVDVELKVEGAPLANCGDDEPWRLSRLRWLNSVIGQEDTVVKPYTAIKRDGSTLRVLGRALRLQPNGLPEQIESNYTQGLTLGTETHKLLAAPVSIVARAGRKTRLWKWGKIQFSTGKATAAWSCVGTSGRLRLEVNGRLGLDGIMGYDLILKSNGVSTLSDFRLEVPYAKDAAQYWCGLGVEGCRRERDLHWKWDVKKHQDALWLGAVNNGAVWRFEGGNYRRPLVNIYYSFSPLESPDSWNASGSGSIDVVEKGDRVLLSATSGKLTVDPKRGNDFAFDVIPTPVKPIDTDDHWATRYYHGDPEQALKDAAPGSYNVVNVHHANDINPFINYPYSPEAFPAFTEFVRKAHAKGLLAKVYYTTRELTQNLPELDALYSLDGEVIFPGPGAESRTLIHPNGPHQWLKDHFDGDYIPAWVQDLGGKFGKQYDLAVITTPESRWNNFYLQGLDYLARKAQIDGIYIDDSALDRWSLLRARRILEKRRPNPMIDLHSWNHFNEHAGYACNIVMYAELLPYVDRIWFGEGYDYDRSPDYWLVEIAGLPFGVMGEMLQNGGNPWRGMLYGMTTRLPWAGDPRPLWKLWDEFGMKGTQMIGYWDPACPVKTGREDVLATVYRKEGRALVSIASWAKEPVSVNLQIDWKALGLDPARARIAAPAVEGFQEARSFATGEPVPVQPGKGWLLVIGRGE